MSLYFQNYIANEIKSGEVFHTLSLIYRTNYIQGAPRKMQLIAYFLDYFKKIEMQHISVFGFIILN